MALRDLDFRRRGDRELPLVVRPLPLALPVPPSPARPQPLPRPPRPAPAPPRPAPAPPAAAPAPAPPAPAPPAEDEGQDVANLIKQEFTDILAGKKGSFTDERVALLKSGLRESTAGQAAASRAQALRDQALLGTLRSGVTARRLQDIDTSARAQFASGVRDILLQQAQSEFQDRMAALQAAQNWLNSRQQYVLGKRQIEATLEAARIHAGATLGAAQLALRGSLAHAGAARAGVRENARQFDEQMAFRREQANVQLNLDLLRAVSGVLGG